MADYPSQAKLFKRWAEAMLNGATVGKPNYSQKSNKGGPKAHKSQRLRRRRFRRKRKKAE